MELFYFILFYKRGVSFGMPVEVKGQPWVIALTLLLVSSSPESLSPDAKLADPLTSWDSSIPTAHPPHRHAGEADTLGWQPCIIVSDLTPPQACRRGRHTGMTDLHYRIWPYMGSGGSNSCLHACMASILFTEVGFYVLWGQVILLLSFLRSWDHRNMSSYQDEVAFEF